MKKIFIQYQIGIVGCLDAQNAAVNKMAKRKKICPQRLYNFRFRVGGDKVYSE